jgi:hypothetical protein
VIYICIPALNEARTIGVLLWKIRQVMEEFPRDYHVLVLDDGSTDDTAEVLEPYVRVLPVTVLRNERTQGYAPAVERLIREAVRLSTHPRRDVLVVMQADFTESPDDIPNLLKRVEGGADVVGSSVAGTEGELPRSLRWSRRGLPWLLSRAPLPKEIKDPLSGFRAYRVSLLKRALQDRDGKPLLTKQHGWAANAELLMCVAPHVRRADNAEVQLRYTRRERTTRFSAWNTALELWNLARTAPRRMAAARAAAAASPEPPSERIGETPPAPRMPRTPRPERPHEERAPRPERGRNEERAPRPERGRNEERAPRPEQGRNEERAPRPERGPRPERPPRQRRERPAAAAALDAETASPAVDEAPQGVGMEEAAPAPRKRKRPPRRRGKKPAAEGQATDIGEDARPGPAADASSNESVGPPVELSAAPSVEGGEGETPAPARRRSRPRRPRRPRTGQPPADGGAEGGGEGPAE